jgi:hypothetical protein
LKRIETAAMESNLVFEVTPVLPPVVGDKKDDDNLEFDDDQLDFNRERDVEDED